MRRLCLYISGEVDFTHALSSSAIHAPHPLHQPREFEQIRHAKERTMLAQDDLRIGSNEIRPLRRNRADGHIIDSQQETSSIAVVPLAHAGELFAPMWMERVRDAHKTR